MKQPPISGRYELEEIVGTGGMSVVYGAWDLKYDRRVAVKVLRPDLDADSDFVRRFNQEAQAASRMSHPNIVDMYDVGQDGDIRYIVMEYASGSTLKELIRENGRIRPQQAVQMALRILAAIDHAHRNQIIHRDIKPQNILVTEEGVIKVADFGIARTLSQSTLTTQGVGNVLGSVHYFSPEQASGRPADEKSDLYSAGVVFYEMVTGRVPFDGETPVAVAYKHVNEQPVSARALNPEVSVGLDEVIMKALAKDVGDRYQTAADMATDLKKALRMPEGGFVEYPASNDPVSPDAGPLKKRAKRRRTMRLAASLMLLAALTAGIIVAVDWYERAVNGVAVPSLVLRTQEEAVALLQGLDLEWSVEERYNEEVRQGAVIDQMPAQGAKVQRGDTVYFSVSRGKGAVMMPNLSDMTRSAAEHMIGENGLTLGGVTLVISSAKPGTVTGQEPAVNEWVHQGAPVHLYVSGESAPVPDLTGRTLDEAAALLAQHNFQLGEAYERLDPAEGGRILEQSVPAGEMALLNVTINVVISQIIPVTYHADESVNVTVDKDGAEVRIVLAEGTDGAREVFREKYDAGNRTISLALDSYTPGEHTLTVYVSGVAVVEKMVTFVERDLDE